MNLTQQHPWTGFSIGIMWKYFIFTIVLLSAGCAPLVIQTPPPVPARLHVAYPPSLKYLVDDLHQCAIQQPEIALTVEETPSADLDTTAAHIRLYFGEPTATVVGPAYLVREDEIVIVAGEGVDLDAIDETTIQYLYTQQESGQEAEYRMWSYGEGNEVRWVFDAILLTDLELSPEVYLAPHPEGMIEAIQEDPYSIGYVPSAWVTPEHHVVKIEGSPSVPVLALTGTAPEGVVAIFFACLQERQ